MPPFSICISGLTYSTKTGGPIGSACFLSYCEILLLHVWEKAHEAGTLDGGLDCTLLTRGELGAAATHHAAVRIDELLEQVNIFVVDVLYVVLSQNVHIFLILYFFFYFLERDVVGIDVFFRVIYP